MVLPKVRIFKFSIVIKNQKILQIKKNYKPLETSMLRCLCNTNDMSFDKHLAVVDFSFGINLC